MDPLQKNSFSFPNSDQPIKGVRGTFMPKESDIYPEPKKKTISILDALQEPKSSGDLKNIKTFQSDLANAVKTDNVSMIKVALAEKKRQEARGDMSYDIPKKKNTLIYIGIGVIIFILVASIVAGAFVFFGRAGTPATQTQTTSFQPILYTKLVSTLNIDSFNQSDTTRIIDQEKEATMDLGDTKALIFTTGTSTAERPLTTEEFFTFIQSRAPDQLLRSLDSNFLLGVYAYTPREVFAIFRVTSYDSAFAGMLQWEPNIESDIGNIFINKKDRVQKSIATASSSVLSEESTSSPYGVFSQRKFVDKIYSNKDVRSLIDGNGKEAMIYTFVDKETLIIATSEKSLKEVLFNLTTGRIVR